MLKYHFQLQMSETFWLTRYSNDDKYISLEQQMYK